MFQRLSYLLLVLRVKYFVFCLYANLTGRDKMRSNQWTVRKEVGSSDSLVGCKNRPRRNWFFGAGEALMLVCHYASCVDPGTEMTVFRDQSIRTHWKTPVLIIHRAGRILTQCYSLDGKCARTRENHCLHFTLVPGAERGIARRQKKTHNFAWRCET